MIGKLMDFYLLTNIIQEIDLQQNFRPCRLLYRKGKITNLYKVYGCLLDSLYEWYIRDNESPELLAISSLIVWKVRKVENQPAVVFFAAGGGQTNEFLQLKLDLTCLPVF